MLRNTHNSEICLMYVIVWSDMVDTVQGPLHSMSQWCWKENRRTDAWPEPWSWESAKKLTLTEPARRRVLKGRNPEHPTQSCESDETECEEAKPFSAPPTLPDNVNEETKIRDSRVGCQIDREGEGRAVCTRGTNK